MPAVSQNQANLMRLVRGIQSGDVPKSKVSAKAKELANTMDPEDVKDFAKTPDKGLPVKVTKESAKAVVEMLRNECKTFKEFVSEIYCEFADYPKTKEHIQKLKECWDGKTVKEHMSPRSGQTDLENDPLLYINSPDKMVQKESVEDCGCNR